MYDHLFVVFFYMKKKNRICKAENFCFLWLRYLDCALISELYPLETPLQVPGWEALLHHNWYENRKGTTTPTTWSILSRFLLQNKNKNKRTKQKSLRLLTKRNSSFTVRLRSSIGYNYNFRAHDFDKLFGVVNTFCNIYEKPRL